MGKKRGEYAKNKARNDIKDFIIEIYKKGISSNLQNLKEEQYHDYYIRYVDLINKLNSDESEKKKKSYKVRDAGSQKDYSYFYTEGTRHLNKNKITKETKKENKVRYLQDKSKTLKKKIEREENNLQEIKQEKDILKQNTDLEEKMAVKQFTNQIIQASKGLMPELYPYLPHDDNDVYSETTNDYFSQLWKNLNDDNRNVLTATKLLLIRKCWKALQSNKLQISFKDLITEMDNLIKMSSGSYDTINPEVKVEVSKSYTQINNQDNSVNNTQINNQQDIEDKNIIEEIIDIPKDYIIRKNNIEDKK